MLKSPAYSSSPYKEKNKPEIVLKDKYSSLGNIKHFNHTKLYSNDEYEVFIPDKKGRIFD
jgi:hypothetical protein